MPLPSNVTQYPVSQQSPPWYLTPTQYAEYQTAHHRAENEAHLGFLTGVARLFVLVGLVCVGLLVLGVFLDRVLQLF